MPSVLHDTPIPLPEGIFHRAFTRYDDAATAKRWAEEEAAQAFAQLAAEYLGGNLTDGDMVAFYDTYAQRTGAGHRSRWDAALGDVFSHRDVMYHRQYGGRKAGR